MNKKLILAGMVITAGFVTLTAFGGKTLEQQKQEIAAAITVQLDDFRAQKQEECTIRVNEEAQRRYDEYLATVPATTPGTKPKTTPRKKPASTTKKDPLPQTAPATNPKKEKMEGTPNTQEKQDKMQSVPNTDKKKKKMEGGGN